MSLMTTMQITVILIHIQSIRMQLKRWKHERMIRPIVRTNSKVIVKVVLREMMAIRSR